MGFLEYMVLQLLIMFDIFSYAKHKAHKEQNGLTNILQLTIGLFAVYIYINTNW